MEAPSLQIKVIPSPCGLTNSTTTSPNQVAFKEMLNVIFEGSKIGPFIGTVITFITTPGWVLNPQPATLCTASTVTVAVLLANVCESAKDEKRMKINERKLIFLIIISFNGYFNKCSAMQYIEPQENTLF